MSWIGTGDAYAASYASLCAGTGARMRELVGLAAGRSLLDVGCGDGTLAAAWSDAGFQITACEPDRSMREAAKRQHPSLQVVDAGLPNLPFADQSFDVVVANFVLNHLDDPRDGARELYRVASDAVIATIWSHSSPLWSEVTAEADLVATTSARLPAGKDFERTASGFERMLRDAGWNPKVDELTWTWRVRPQALWASVDGGVAGAGAFYRTLTDADRLRFRAAFDRIVAARMVADHVALEQTAAIAISLRAPG
ncbi:class I SAM-dependent methyltransferase [Microbacterium esteraromaticum]|nr:class I SAM-dependent methyltransferase [Microbacterium esteraromaticum]